MDHVPLEMPNFMDATAQLYGPGDHNTALRTEAISDHPTTSTGKG
jgi:hypothetical protein